MRRKRCVCGAMHTTIAATSPESGVETHNLQTTHLTTKPTHPPRPNTRTHSSNTETARQQRTNKTSVRNKARIETRVCVCDPRTLQASAGSRAPTEWPSAGLTPSSSESWRRESRRRHARTPCQETASSPPAQLPSFAPPKPQSRPAAPC